MSTSPDLVFKICNSLALLCWLALAVSPARAGWTPWVWRITGRVVPLAFALVYLTMLLTRSGNEGGFNSIAQVQALFRDPGALVAGWVHYLAFDLFVGTWIAERGARLGIAHWWLLPLLLLTFMLGPLGLLGFILLRAVLRPQSLKISGTPS